MVADGLTWIQVVSRGFGCFAILIAMKDIHENTF